MARVLIGWELGGGLGHIVQTTMAAGALAARGHTIGLALQDLSALHSPPEGVTLFQAPLWPGLFHSFKPTQWRRATTLIDILARLGLERPHTLARLIACWDSLFAAFKPDLVIADHAPAMLAAALGRLPSIAVGTGFAVPPPGYDQPMRMETPEPGYDEAAMLDVIDADLREAGREPLDTLGSLFRYSRAVISTFAELDPYGRDPGAAGFSAPSLENWSPPAAQPATEVFAYVRSPLQDSAEFWNGLAQSRLKVRTYAPGVSTDGIATLRKSGILVEQHPVSWKTIAARSRVVLSYGGHGTMCGAMLAGLPQIAIPFDLEKRLHATAGARHGLVTHLNPDGITAAGLANVLRELWSSSDALTRARENAPEFARRMARSFRDRVVEETESLAQL